MTNDHCRCAVQALLVGSKSAAASRLDAEGLKKMAGNSSEIEAYRLAATRDGGQAIAIYREIIEGVVLGEKVGEIWVRQVHAMAVRRLFPDANDLLGIWVGKRAKQYGVYDREDRS